MSPDQDLSREDRDTLLTAYALGMVTPEERADVERLGGGERDSGGVGRVDVRGRW